MYWKFYFIQIFLRNVEFHDVSFIINFLKNLYWLCSIGVMIASIQKSRDIAPSTTTLTSCWAMPLWHDTHHISYDIENTLPMLLPKTWLEGIILVSLLQQRHNWNGSFLFAFCFVITGRAKEIKLKNDNGDVFITQLINEI